MKSLQDKLPAQKIFAAFDAGSTRKTLVQLCSELIDLQKREWPELKDGYDALKSVQVRHIECNGYSVTVQFNPKRIRSTGVDLKEETIKMRKCFLCIENLPERQKGILYNRDSLLLCNPVPIFDRHFTFSSIYHRPQELASSLNLLFDLAKDLCPEFSVFYNGPKSGASAPDHFHFQISPKRSIPVETDAVDMKRRKRVYYKNHITGCYLMNYGRTVFIVESTDRNRLSDFFNQILPKWKETLGSVEEPKLNIICSYQEELWRLIILPRRKHRPDIYYLDSEERVLISPAAVDIGGLIVTPLEKDFYRVDANLVQKIYDEVTEKPDILEKIMEDLN